MIKIPWAKPFLGKEEKEFLLDALASTRISHGPYVEGFEKSFAKLQGQKFCVTTNSGTSALYLALLAVGIKRTDEVIVPGFGFMAAANMVLAVGAKPLYADINPDTWCMEPAEIFKKISKRTKAIVVVHPYGNVCDMPAIKQLARRHNLLLIEDVAQSPFSRYQGKLAGTFAEMGCFSFQATKTIAMGEGGCVLTSNKKLNDKMRVIRNHGMTSDRRYWHEEIGQNFRLTNLQAALGVAQLKKLKEILEGKKRIHALYRKYLAYEEGVVFQLFSPKVDAVVWAVAVRIDPKVFGVSRDTLIKRLLERGIETRPGFYPPSKMPFYKAPALPIAESIAENILVLPSFVQLTEQQVKDVCNHIKKLKA